MNVYQIGFFILIIVAIMSVIICYLKGAVDAVYQTFEKGKESNDDPFTWTSGLIYLGGFVLFFSSNFFVEKIGWIHNPIDNEGFVIITFAVSLVISWFFIDRVIRIWIKLEKPKAKFVHIIGLRLKSM